MCKVFNNFVYSIFFLLYFNNTIAQTKQNCENYLHFSYLIAKGHDFEKRNFDSVFFYYNNALNKLLELQNESPSDFISISIAYNYYLLANASINYGNNIWAKEYYEKGMLLIDKIPFIQNKYIYALYLKLSALIDVETDSNMQKTIVSIYKAKLLFEKQNNIQDLAECYLLLGRINTLKKMPSLAIQNFKSALELYNGSNMDVRTVTNCLNYLGTTYKSINVYDSAYFFIDKSNMLSQREGDTIGLTVNLIQLAALYSTKLTSDRKFKMLNCYKKALGLAQKSKSFNNELNVLIQLAFFYNDYQEFNTSIEYSKAALSLVKQNHLGIHLLEKIAFNIFNDYYYTKDYFNAIQWYQHYFHYAMDNLTEQNNKLLTELEIKYKTQEKEHKIQLKNIEIKDKTKKIKNITLGLLLLAFLVAVLLFLYLHIKKKNRILISQNKEINAIVQAQNDFLVDYINNHNEELNHNSHPRSSIDDIKKNDYLKKLLQMLNKEKLYTDKELTLEKLAEAVGTNRTYLSQIINDYAKTNYNTFINNYRIKEACLFLAEAKNQHYPIKSIYDLFGFNSDKYFCEVFKKQTGFSPSVYRKKMRS